ncbi:MAG: c-type cytochrome [Nitrospirae bacterium]|nr:MAG: c-type cytochrome [Nitrospirota bacterium]
MSVHVRPQKPFLSRLMTLILVMVGMMGLPSFTMGQAEEPTTDQQAQRLLASRCSVCHSQDLVQQQRLPRDRWEATVTKMVHWGAQLDKEEEAMLTTYLATYFHPEAGPVVALPAAPSIQADQAGRESGAAPTPGGAAARGASLYKQNCLPCHGEAGNGGVGPKLARNPILTQADRFRTTVSQGRGAMPPWGAVLRPQEITDILAWLNTLHD